MCVCVLSIFCLFHAITNSTLVPTMHCYGPCHSHSHRCCLTVVATASGHHDGVVAAIIAHPLAPRPHNLLSRNVVATQHRHLSIVVAVLRLYRRLTPCFVTLWPTISSPHAAFHQKFSTKEASSEGPSTTIATGCYQ